MHLKNTRKKIAIISILSIIVIFIISTTILLLTKAKPLPPEIGLLYVDNYILTINPSKKYQEESSNNEALRYCLNIKNNPNTCNWQQSPKFQIEYDHTYYAYIKSLDTNLISNPEVINYSIPDYNNYHEE